MATFEAALVAGRTQVVIANIRWDRFREVYELRGPTELLRQMPARGPAAARQGHPPLSRQLSTLPPEQHADCIRRHVEAVVAHVLKLPEGQTVSRQTGFADLGVDSLMAIELRRRLSSDLGVALATTLVFDYPDCERLAEHLQAQWAEAGKDVPASPEATGATDADTEAEAELNRKLSQLGI